MKVAKGNKTIFDLSQIVKTLKFAFYGLEKRTSSQHTEFGSSLWVIIGLLGNDSSARNSRSEEDLYNYITWSKCDYTF